MPSPVMLAAAAYPTDQRYGGAYSVVRVAPMRLRVEADPDHGVTSRILDLLMAIDCYPRKLHLEHDEFHLTLDLVLDPDGARPMPIAVRIRQISGVRKVVEVGFCPS